MATIRVYELLDADGKRIKLANWDERENSLDDWHKNREKETGIKLQRRFKYCFSE